MTRKTPKALKPVARKSAPTRRGHPFKQLVDAGIRLAALRTPKGVQDFLVKEAARLCRAQRILLLLEDAGAVRIAGAPLLIETFATCPSGIIAPPMVGTSTWEAIMRGSERSSRG